MTAEPKKQKRNVQAWLNLFFGAQRIEFVSPYSLEQCVDLLNQQHNTQLFANPKIRAKLQPIDDDTQYLRFTVAYGQSNRMAVTGYLKRWEQNTTLINVMPLSYPLQTLIIFCIFAIGAVIFSVSGFAAGLQNTLIGLVIALIIIAFGYSVYRISLMGQYDHLQWGLQKLLQVDPSN